MANHVDSLGTNVNKMANLGTPEDMAILSIDDDAGSGHLVNGVDYPSRCYECGGDLTVVDGYYDENGLPWCMEHGPTGVGGPV